MLLLLIWRGDSVNLLTMVVVLIWFQCDVKSIECGVNDNCGVGWC